MTPLPPMTPLPARARSTRGNLMLPAVNFDILQTPLNPTAPLPTHTRGASVPARPNVPHPHNLSTVTPPNPNMSFKRPRPAVTTPLSERGTTNTRDEDVTVTFETDLGQYVYPSVTCIKDLTENGVANFLQTNAFSITPP